MKNEITFFKALESTDIYISATQNSEETSRSGSWWDEAGTIIRSRKVNVILCLFELPSPLIGLISNA